MSKTCADLRLYAHLQPRATTTVLLDPPKKSPFRPPVKEPLEGLFPFPPRSGGTASRVRKLDKTPADPPNTGGNSRIKRNLAVHFPPPPQVPLPDFRSFQRSWIAGHLLSWIGRSMPLAFLNPKAFRWLFPIFQIFYLFVTRHLKHQRLSPRQYRPPHLINPALNCSPAHSPQSCVRHLQSPSVAGKYPPHVSPYPR